MLKIKRALISVSNKEGIVEFATELQNLGVEIISTGGTAALLNSNNVKCIKISDVTDFPEILNGRVKTLHPRIHGGILARKDDNAHLQQLKEHGIELIDMVVVNLYPFEATVAKQDVTLDEVIENIDIGGPTLVRAAAKNYKNVSVVTDPSQYELISNELKQNDGTLSENILKSLAVDAFQMTNKYDGLITRYLSNVGVNEFFPERVSISLKKISNLRYGENPHQRAAFYHNIDQQHTGISDIEILNGKELSYNNIVDLDSVVRIVNTLNAPGCVIVKHNNPCGVGIGLDSHDAFKKAFATDSLSAFGGIYGFNRTIDLSLAEELAKIFIEVIVAPDYASDALTRLKKKKNLRLLKLPLDSIEDTQDIVIKDVLGGLLFQESDNKGIDDIKFRVVTERQPTEPELVALKFGWQIVKWIKSNAIVFVKEDRTIGIGAGQMSRVDSVLLAIDKAKRAGLVLQDTVVASDAFFPFRDGIDKAAEVGATAVIQPGGSVRDAEVIEAANEHNMSMIFTDVRHFRH